MLNPYHDKIDIDRIFELQQSQYMTSLPLSVTVDPLQTIDAGINITSLGHFMLLNISGDYTTLNDDPAVDDGTCHIFFQLIDGSNSREIFSEPGKASLYLSPGRSKTSAIAGNDSDSLRLFYNFIYTFPMNGRIIVRVRNDATAANTVNFQFTGIRRFPLSREQS